MNKKEERRNSRKNEKIEKKNESWYEKKQFSSENFLKTGNKKYNGEKNFRSQIIIWIKTSYNKSWNVKQCFVPAKSHQHG